MVRPKIFLDQHDHDVKRSNQCVLHVVVLTVWLVIAGPRCRKQPVVASPGCFLEHPWVNGMFRKAPNENIKNSLKYINLVHISTLVSTKILVGPCRKRRNRSKDLSDIRKMEAHDDYAQQSSSTYS